MSLTKELQPHLPRSKNIVEFERVAGHCHVRPPGPEGPEVLPLPPPRDRDARQSRCQGREVTVRQKRGSQKDVTSSVRRRRPAAAGPAAGLGLRQGPPGGQVRGPARRDGPRRAVLHAAGLAVLHLRPGLPGGRRRQAAGPDQGAGARGRVRRDALNVD